MPSIDDFINRRWADAKEEMRGLDPNFVDELESSDYPEGLIRNRTPRQRLSTEWHRLLGYCCDLSARASLVEIAARSLKALADEVPQSEVAGRQASYHIASWIIYLNALCESVEKVIKGTTALYIYDKNVRKRKEQRYCDSANKYTKEIQKARNGFAHAGTLGGESITANSHWEAFIAVGITARMLQDDHYRQIMEDELKQGDPNRYIDATERFLEHFGSILGELEKDIADQSALATAQETVLARFRRAFPESERWFGPKQGYGSGDDANSYERFQFREYGSSIYFPHGEDHAHIVPRSVRRFRPVSELLQQCLDENRVPLGCEDQYVVRPQHADAIIAVLRKG